MATPIADQIEVRHWGGFGQAVANAKAIDGVIPLKDGSLLTGKEIAKLYWDWYGPIYKKHGGSFFAITTDPDFLEFEAASREEAKKWANAP